MYYHYYIYSINLLIGSDTLLDLYMSTHAPPKLIKNLHMNFTKSL